MGSMVVRLRFINGGRSIGDRMIAIGGAMIFAGRRHG